MRGGNTNHVYSETGGIRYGSSFYMGMNATWPLAKIKIFHDRIRHTFAVPEARLFP